jgi:hypothetical protein
MAAKGITLPIIFKADNAGLNQAGSAVEGFGKKLAGLAGIVAAAFSVRAITNFAKESVLVAEAAATAQSRLEAVAKATGMFGDQTQAVTDRLGEFAKAQEMRIAVDDKVIKGVQGQLLTFKGLAASADETGGAYDRATLAAFDMAAVYGSAESAAMGLGKALEDPIRGVGALRKQGVSFNKEQLEQIKTLQESGDLLGAQTLILDEIESQYGGVAEATANASDKFAILAENIKEEVGEPLLQIFNDLIEDLEPVMVAIGATLGETIKEMSPVLQSIGEMIPGLVESFIPMIPILGELAAVFFEIIERVLPVFVNLFEDLLPVIEELVPILADAFLEVLDALLPIFLQLIDAVMPIVKALLPVLLDLVIKLSPVFIALIEAMLPMIDRILPLFIGFIEFLTPIIVWLAELLGKILVVAIDFLITAFEKAQVFFDKFGRIFENIWIGVQIIFATVINGMIAGFEAFINFFIKGFNTLVKAYNAGAEALGLKTLKLAAEVQFGRLEVPKLKPMALGGIVTGPTAALIGEAGPEAVIPLSKFDSLGGGNTYNITVNAGMGTDGARLGQQIVSAIKKYERVSGPVFASV